MLRLLYFLILSLIAVTCYAQKYSHDSLKTKEGYLHYYTKGEGKPIILLPGGPGFSSFYMRGISDSLVNYHTILIDFPGTGRSRYKEPDSTWVSQANMVNDVEMLRKHLAIDHWIVLGQSWAAQTALLYGITYPKRTSRIILQATPGTDNDFQKWYGDNISMRLRKEDFDRMASIRQDSTAGRFDLFKIRFRGYFYDPEKAGYFFEMPMEEEDFFFNGRFFQAFIKNPDYDAFDISKESYALDIPIRIIQGRQDPINGGTQERLNERLKNSKIIYIERSGHFPWLEQPEAFFKALRTSLSD